MFTSSLYPLVRRNLEALYQTPHEAPWDDGIDRAAAREKFQSVVAAGNPILSERDSKELLAAYGIPTTLPVVARSAEATVAEAHRQGYPVVLKINSPDITHKTDVHGVALNLSDEQAVAAAYQQILASAHAHQSEARLDGVTVQRMVTRGRGLELILGAKQDPVFGSVVMVGMGGVAAELLGDRALELPPLNDALARQMLRSLRLWPLLAGYRGEPAMNIEGLIEVMPRFSYFVTDFPEITEIDVNPLWITTGDIVALDARIVVDLERVSGPVRPFSHLAICLYPSRFVRRIELADGTTMVLRPIRPEDEPQWRALHDGCSSESIRSRFHNLFKQTTHDFASRFCFSDYDRDLSIVAEVEIDRRRQLAAVASLSADPDHRTAEFAVLVGNDWQGRGLGTMLTRYCLEIARGWQLSLATAETEPSNTRMIQIFKQLGFTVRQDSADGVVRAECRATA